MDNYTNLEVFCSKRFSLQDILKALWLIQDLQKFFYNTGLDTMARVFPQKIIELQKIIDDRSVSLFHPSRLASNVDSSLDYMLSEQSHKKRKLSRDAYLVNHLTSSKTIPDMLPDFIKSYSQSLKSECEDLVQHTDQALVWLASTHRNSTENLDAREVLLSELHRAQEAGISMHEMTGKYYLSRAELGSKIDMHLGIEDYALALQAHDEHQLFLIRQHLRDLRNIYMSLYDNVKNVLA